MLVVDIISKALKLGACNCDVVVVMVCEAHEITVYGGLKGIILRPCPVPDVISVKLVVALKAPAAPFAA